uniref:peptidoglycan binding domain-containing protein n=1 Tax=Agathobacter sp. TaxID=2021311 RepID=UPI0040570EBC
MSTKKKILITSGIIAGILLTLYIGLSVYFMSHFFFKVTINGIDVSGCSVAEAQEKMQTNLSTYALSIVERDGTTEAIPASEIDLVIEWDGQTEKLIENQNGFAWIVKLFQPDSFSNEVEMKYDEAKLSEKINALSCMKEEKQIEPVNAAISEYNAESGFSLVPSVPGTAINKEMLDAGIRESIMELKPELVLADALCYNLPAIADDHAPLLAAIDTLNKCVSTVLTYQVGSSTQVLDASTFVNWLTVSDDFTVSINDELLTEYVKSLESTYNTAYKPKKLKTSYGAEVTITKGSYGWKINRDAEKTAIKENIFAGEAITRDLNYSMTANSHDGNDYGNSYVEINLTAQHLFLYVNGKLIVESDFVSGNSSKGWDSPTGAYPLTYKDKDAVLRGENYETPVTYWMPFAGNVGMHDATWRSSFGASIYKRDGSHGCINLPKSAAKTIFENIDAGFPVLCYKLSGTESTAGVAQDKAYAVIDAIKAIGTVTLEKESKILAARSKYDALSDLGKKYVTNYKTLTNAETTLNDLKAAQVPQEPVIEQPSTEQPAAEQPNTEQPNTEQPAA